MASTQKVLENPATGQRRGTSAPLFRWNHNWGIQHLMEGLEPYAKRTAAAAAPDASG